MTLPIRINHSARPPLELLVCPCALLSPSDASVRQRLDHFGYKPPLSPFCLPTLMLPTSPALLRFQFRLALLPYSLLVCLTPPHFATTSVHQTPTCVCACVCVCVCLFTGPGRDGGGRIVSPPA
ncbi:unnamed protein product [Protopolystoma xenopodis]|uniref:Uncharacterized protein n=1 Tax=Protopolystoma xenopodis TaxID=117903 RepID=A0A3S5ARH4_9PLAT|nr:unnamed protein product [Protopolystoma xenopodis]